jgi:hypothetical protein
MITVTTLTLFLPLLSLAAVSPAGKGMGDRQPAVAGMFYPDRAEELRHMLSGFFATAVSRREGQEVIAIISPHAGYVYSGQVAASAFNQLDPDHPYDTIFILGPSHRVGFQGAAVYCAGDFITPLGTVQVNRELGLELTRKSTLFTARTDAHAMEHSVEVQLPFLQHHLKRPFRIVPIVLGVNSPTLCRQVGEVLKPFLGGNNLMVVSTDFSHYPAYDQAVKVDRAVAEAIIENSADTLVQTMARYEAADIDNLATTLCGVSGVLTLMAMTAGRSDLSYHPLHYQNSGDIPMTDKRRVVGYHAIMVTKEKKEDTAAFALSPQDKETLLGLARTTIARYVVDRSLPEVDGDHLSAELNTPCGAFVTLKKRGQLRGCIGRFDASEPLYQVVGQMAVAAATEDYRFRPVVASEVPELTIDISVLTPMRRINSIAEFELGRHGIYIRQGARSGTFLPQVAQDTGWTAEEFLGHCAQDKAGIGWQGWKEAELYVYEALVFGEQEPS